ncbi:NADH-quinone oxidoreductase subunit G [Tomitella fengzijianii]|uniref:NADH-quinone oxidoreductase n=1 Tax=Tomitella fengzijianii TaxID=2597660 RepID=A0A516X2D3_9ACTN|nr:NADH-quinone oxidoreductase subunit G [Tomitella fengzijianii]QDQ97203.1 NADH-quinone oxidoreductase subunit G [Tomitella fengzijianii]
MTAPQGAAPQPTVTFTIDGRELTVPKGTLVIRAAESIGIEIPRFCDHPLLDPVGACRQCLVDVEGQRKPLASCTTVAADGMVVRTQETSPVADKAQRGVIEFLLINHPLDCPVCDKGGECPLQNQALEHGDPETRFGLLKREYPKPINLSAQILLDRERCVLCARCTRFSEQIAGDPFIDMLERGALQQVGVYGKQPLDSYFSGNTVQICPVGALTDVDYRFRSRPFDLVSTPSVCEHCASGCAQRTDHRRGTVLRRYAGEDPEVNEEWNCDKGRFAFAYTSEPDRITGPLVRGDDGELAPASWPAAVRAAAKGLADAAAAGVLVGGRSTWEDAYAYAKFARVVLGTDDIDHRVRAHSDEELDFLAQRVAGRRLQVTYADLESAPVVVLAGFEPEEESPIVYLRLRKAARTRRMPVYSLAPFASAGLRRMNGRLLETAPGREHIVLDGIAAGAYDDVGTLLRSPGAVILGGERLASAPGALTAACRLADATGARLAWIPRRAGERGAVEAGTLPGLLPGGRRLAEPDHRRQVAAYWGIDALPTGPGRDTAGILAAARDGEVDALLVGGVDPDDLPDAHGAREALERCGFVVSLEMRRSAVTDAADVVLPVAPAQNKAGTFLDWEGRGRLFDVSLTEPGLLPDLRILHILAGRMGADLGLPHVGAARAELAALGTAAPGAAEPRSGAGVASARAAAPDLGTRATGGSGGGGGAPEPGQAVLSTWRMLLDQGRMQDGRPNLAATARRPVVRLSAGTARQIDASEGDQVTVSTSRGAVTLPLAITAMPDGTVWLPMNSPGSAVYPVLGAAPGSMVGIRGGGAS